MSFPRRILCLTSVLIAGLPMTSCASPPSPNTTAQTPASPSVHAPAGHWGYEGTEGPEHWGDLSPEYELCGIGQQQTPIDLSGATPQDAPDVTFNYRSIPLTVVNNGHTIQVPSEGGGDIAVGDESWALTQFHFHTPSEHTVEGAAMAGELHLVHQDPAGRIAVVGVLIKQGAENAALSTIVDDLPGNADQTAQPSGVTIDPLTLLPEERLAFHYTGSLTTPPCSEGVRWFVMTTPIEMSDAQLAALEDVMGHNSRPVQPRNDRELLEDTVAADCTIGPGSRRLYVRERVAVPWPVNFARHSPWPMAASRTSSMRMAGCTSTTTPAADRLRPRHPRGT